MALENMDQKDQNWSHLGGRKTWRKRGEEEEEEKKRKKEDSSQYQAKVWN